MCLRESVTTGSYLHEVRYCAVSCTAHRLDVSRVLTDIPSPSWRRARRKQQLHIRKDRSNAMPFCELVFHQGWSCLFVLRSNVDVAVSLVLADNFIHPSGHLLRFHRFWAHCRRSYSWLSLMWQCFGSDNVSTHLYYLISKVSMVLCRNCGIQLFHEDFTQWKVPVFI